MPDVQKALDRLGRTTPHRCGCPTCQISQSMRVIRAELDRVDAAQDAWLNQSAELEGEAVHYREEMVRLRDALDAIESALGSDDTEKVFDDIRRVLTAARGDEF